MGPKKPRTGSSSSSRALIASPRPPPPPPVVEGSPEFFGIHLHDAEHLKLFHVNKRRCLVPTRYLDFDMVDALGLRDNIDWLAERLGWQAFIHLRETTYAGLTLEFLSTVHCNLLSGTRVSEGLCTFRLGNVDRELGLEAISKIFGFSPPTGPRGESRVHFCNAVTFWNAIGSGSYEAKRTKASGISNPALRLFHRFMAHTIFGRGEGGENSASKKELFFLCAALEDHVIGSAAFLMSHLSLQGHKSAGEIAIGGIVTRLARHFGLDLGRRNDGIPPQPISFPLLQHMRVLYSYHDAWYWALPESEQLVRLPCNPARISLRQPATWRLVPRSSDPTHERLRAGPPLSDDDMDDDDMEDDENVDVAVPAARGPVSSDPRLLAMLESMQRDMATQFSHLTTQIAMLHEKIDDIRLPGGQPGPPPPTQE